MNSPHSSIIPKDSVKLMASALWHGFDFNFGDMIHILCPQVEKMVRYNLRKEGIKTSMIKDGIETESSLGTIIENANRIFGEDVTF